MSVPGETGKPESEEPVTESPLDSDMEEMSLDSNQGSQSENQVGVNY